MNIGLVIFDCDGVLVDSERIAHTQRPCGSIATRSRPKSLVSVARASRRVKSCRH